jgi:hypothetical protein
MRFTSSRTFPGQLHEEEVSQQLHIPATLPKWRHLDAQHVELVVQSLAEPAVFYRSLQVGVGGRNNSHVDFFGPQNAQQACLQIHREVPDFVQYQGSLPGRSHRFEQHLA